MAVNQKTDMLQAIQAAIEEQAKAAQEVCIAVAVQKFERLVRDAVGKAAINVSEFYSVQQMGPEIIIRVWLDSARSTRA